MNDACSWLKAVGLSGTATLALTVLFTIYCNVIKLEELTVLLQCFNLLL